MEGLSRANEQGNERARYSAEIDGFLRWQAEQSGEIAEKAKEGVGRATFAFMAKMTRIGAILSIGMATLEEADHVATRYQVTETNGVAGDLGLKDTSGPATPEVIYEHQDPETTEILNWLSGRGELSDEHKTAIFRESVRTIIEARKMPMPADIDTLTRPELEAFLANLYLKDKVIVPNELNAKNSATFSYYDAARSYEYNPQLYAALWKTEKSVGAPRIRFTFEDDRDMQQRNAAGGHHAWYKQVNNTMYIDAAAAFRTFFSESAHSKQWQDAPLTSDARWMMDQVTVTYRQVAKDESLDDSYNEEYSIPGTIENEAHSVFEPELKKAVENVNPMPKPNPAMKDVDRYYGRE